MASAGEITAAEFLQVVASPVDQKPTTEVIHFFRVPLIHESATSELLKSVQAKISNQIIALQTEQYFNIGVQSEISNDKLSVLRWLLQETYEPENLN
ncbi:unnamed protein product [Citrullus colocynthis]|uniref:Uncharacterized protein n=1 Tax=Citrullus colocynthis TaxID=252529 RepID=A0ABP0YTN2_9ROSI